MGPAGVFSLFPAEEAEGEEGAEGGQGEHAADRGQDAARTDAEERVFHHRDALRQRKDADDRLHSLRHDLEGEGRAGKEEHGEIEDGGDDAGLSGILRHTADQQADGKRREHGQRPAAEERRKRAAQPHAPQQRRRGQRRQRHEAVDDVHGQLDAQNEHRADRRHAEALEDLQLPQAGYGLRLSMARKRLSRPLTGAACFAIFRHE